MHTTCRLELSLISHESFLNKICKFTKMYVYLIDGKLYRSTFTSHSDSVCCRCCVISYTFTDDRLPSSGSSQYVFVHMLFHKFIRSLIQRFAYCKHLRVPIHPSPQSNNDLIAVNTEYPMHPPPNMICDHKTHLLSFSCSNGSNMTGA
jgi:hypothetical protein